MTTLPEGWTKGPWEVSSTEEIIEVNGADGATVHFEDLHGAEQSLITEAVANAHLISAAPDMFEALTNCVTYMSSSLRMSRDEDEAARRQRIIDAALAALAKARGESPPPSHGSAK